MFHKFIGKPCIAALPLVLAMAVQEPALAAGPTTFGAPTYNSTIGFDISLDAEKKAFAAYFSGLEVVLDIPQRPQIVTRTFSLSLPVKAEPGVEIPLVFQGTFLASKGATGHLIVTIMIKQRRSISLSRWTRPTSKKSNTRWARKRPSFA
jgi:hypothetical protein